METSETVVVSEVEEKMSSLSEETSSDKTTTQVVETTTTTTTVTTVKSTTTTSTTTSDADDSDGSSEPPFKVPKLDDGLGDKVGSSSSSEKDVDLSSIEDGDKGDSKIVLNSSSALAEAIKASGDGKPKVINLQSLLPSARQSLLNAVDKGGEDGKSDGPQKTVLLVNREGGKVTLQVQRQPSGQEESGNASQTTITTTANSSVESRKMTTRSKTGSLTPKLFTDSITMTTSSLKTSNKSSSEEVIVSNKEGEVTKSTRKISVTSNLFQLSSHFKLGAECSFKHFQNQYTTNHLALNKHQHNEERDKKRHLSHKFSLTSNSEFKWNGVVVGNRISTLSTLRLTITNLESNIQAPFMHSNWPSYRQHWQKAVQMCQSPRDFALALLVLEACIKPCVFNPVWHEALGHVRLSRITVSDREEWKKKEKEQRRRLQDEDEGGHRPVVWIKYTMGLKHQVWKQKGEEYRVTGGNGWQWVSATRVRSEVPQDSVGLRLVAQRLKNRRVRTAKAAMKNQKEPDDDAEEEEEEKKSVGDEKDEEKKSVGDEKDEEKKSEDEKDEDEKDEEKMSVGDEKDEEKSSVGDEKDEEEKSVGDEEDEAKKSGDEKEEEKSVGNEKDEEEKSVGNGKDEEKKSVGDEKDEEKKSVGDEKDEEKKSVGDEKDEEKMSVGDEEGKDKGGSEDVEMKYQASKVSEIKEEVIDEDEKESVDSKIENKVESSSEKVAEVKKHKSGKKVSTSEKKTTSVEAEVKPMSIRARRRQSAMDHYLSYMKDKYTENKDNVLALELLKKHPEKADVDLVNVSDALQKRSLYQKVTKPNSKLDNLLERRLKQDEFERKQRMTVETQIALKEKLTQAIETAQRRKDAIDKRQADKEKEEKEKKNSIPSAKLVNGEVPEPSVSRKTIPQCYSLSCRTGEGPGACYSPACRKAKQIREDSAQVASSDAGNKETAVKDDKSNIPENSTPDSNQDTTVMNNDSGKSLSETKEGGEEKEGHKTGNEAKDEKSGSTGPADESMEDEEIDIEGVGKETPKKGEKKADDSGVSGSSKSDGDKDSASVASKSTSVSDIVKNLVIKTMAEKAVASGKGNPLAAQSITNAVANVTMKELESRLPPKRLASDKFKLAKFTKLAPKKDSKVSKNGRLPKCHKFETTSHKKSVLILERSELKKIARQGSKRESTSFNYNCKVNHVCWPYPCPRPFFKTAWRYRTICLQSLSAAALQLRIMWATIRWDDMSARPPAGGTNTVSTETEITTTELLKRREVGENGLRSEFLVRKIVVPLGVPEKPKEKYTPQRSGLRERKRAEASRPTEPSVTEVWVPEEVLELWEIKQFGEKLERQRQALQEKAQAEKAAAAVSVQTSTSSGTVTSQQSSAQIKAQMEQQLKQQRLALAQKRIQETQGIKITTVTSGSTTSTTTSGTTIIINSGSQLGKPGATFKTLTVSSASSLLSQGVLKGVQPKTLIAGSLLGTSIRPGLRVQLPPSSGTQLRPQGVTLAPKPGMTTSLPSSAAPTITKLISPSTSTASPAAIRISSPAVPQAAKAGQTIQIKPAATGGQPVQSLQFIQTPGGQLQVRGLLPGQIIQRMPDGKFQILTLSSGANTSSTGTSPATANQSTAASPQVVTAPQPRHTLNIRPQQTIMVTVAGSSGASPATQSRLVIPAQLASSLSASSSSPATPGTVRLAAASGPVASGTPRQIIMTRPGGPAQVISAPTLATVLGSQASQISAGAALGSITTPSGSLNTAVVISAPGTGSSPATILGSSAGTGVGTILVASSSQSILSSQASPQTIISTLKPAQSQVAATTATTTCTTATSGTSLLAGQVISGTSLLQRSGTSLLSLNPSATSGGTITLAPGQVPKLLASPSAGGTQIITQQVPGSSQPQIILRPSNPGGQPKIITAQQLRGLTGGQAIQIKPAGSGAVVGSPIKTILSPQAVLSTPTAQQQQAGAKTLSAIRSLTPQLLSGVAVSSAATTTVVTTATSLLPAVASPETAISATVTSPTAGISPSSGSSKYAITPQVVEQVVRQALLQNQAPEIQSKLLAMQRQIQQKAQPTGSGTASVLSLSSSTTPSSSRRVTVGTGSSFSANRSSSSGSRSSAVSAVASGSDSSRAKSNKYLTPEQKEEQSRASVCGQVMKNILDRIERDEKQEQRNKKRQESVEEKQKRMNVLNQQKALFKHKESLKKEIHRKRSIMERNVQQEVYNEMAEVVKKAKATLGLPKSPPAGTAAVAAPSTVIPVSTVATAKTSKKQQQHQQLAGRAQVAETPKAKIIATDNKNTPASAASRKRKQKIISTGFKGLNPREKLYCVCKTPYDDSKFYIGCDLCSNWFHGACVSISESQAKSIDSYICEDCRKQQENTSEELYCLCRTPYDENQFYVGCDRCQDWFHGECVGISKAEADNLDVYVCPNCDKQETADPIAQKHLSLSEYQELQRLLKDIQAHKMSWPFLSPVDPREVPDYYRIVAEPMDLTIVEAKLNAKTYKRLNDFMKDVTKIFDNCRLYNPVGTPYFQCAEVVETYFAQKVKNLRSSHKL